MDDKNYYVYIHTNKTNQKKYVGMTKLKPQTRWGSQGGGYRNQERFYTEIQQYGWDGFEHEIVCKGLTKKEAQEKEIELIKKYTTYDVAFGYNKYCKTLRDYNYSKKKPIEIKYVYCVELDSKYKTSKEASLATGIDASSILKACKGIRHSAGKHPETKEKLHWEYVVVAEC